MVKWFKAYYFDKQLKKYVGFNVFGLVPEPLKSHFRLLIFHKTGSNSTIFIPFFNKHYSNPI